LRALGRDAYVSPEMEGKTVVYDRLCDDQRSYQPLMDLALALTGTLECGALGFLNALDEYLLCMLFSSGEYLGGRAWGEQVNPPLPELLLPRVRFAEQLCELLNTGLDAQRTDALLARIDTIMAEDRKEGLVKYVESVVTPFTIHTLLAAELGLGHYTAGIGYRAILAAETGVDTSWVPEGFSRIEGLESSEGPDS
ncbi:hypothetical protein HQ576_08025, partial [bacterium]|nr:hypothetical protein [bacterium]